MPDCTEKAITHQIAKIKTDAKEQNNGAPSTPSAATTKVPKGTGTKRKSAKNDAGLEGSGYADESPTKPKKARAAPKSKAKATSKSAAAAAEDDSEEAKNGFKAEENADVNDEDGLDCEAA